MKKNSFWLIVAIVLLTVTISVTVAYLIDSAQTVENTFTVGEVKIALNETTGTQFKLAPGVIHLKDPTVTVKANSENCFVFVKIQKSQDFDYFCTFNVEGFWTALEGNPDIYYLQCNNKAADQYFNVLKNNRITVKDTLTEEEINALTVNPELKFTAYAIQSTGFSSALDAWNVLNQ